MERDTGPDDAAAQRADPASAPGSGRLTEVVLLFLKLGFTAFGGPAAHIAMMRQEVVQRRRWLTDEQFLDLLGATNLIPGPNSTEMAIHLGYERAGWRGLILGGACFIIPAMCIVLALAWLYREYGATPQATWLLYGIKPVIIAVVAQALWGLRLAAAKSWPLAAIGAAVVALYLVGGNEIALLLGSGLFVLIAQNGRRLWKNATGAGAFVVLGPAIAGLAPVQASASSFSLVALLLTFLKIGSVLYGSGYVLLAFLRNDFVVRTGWLTDQQLLDAVAIGQFTPGPVFTTATFIGFLLAGIPGGLLATVAIFLPGFVFVAITNPLIPRLRRSPWASAFLDGVNVAAFALMAAVTWELGRAAIIDIPTVLLALAAGILLIRFKVNSVWLIVAGGLFGGLWHLAGISA